MTARDSVVYTLVLADVGPRSIAEIGALSAFESLSDLTVKNWVKCECSPTVVFIIGSPEYERQLPAAAINPVTSSCVGGEHPARETLMAAAAQA